MTHDGAFVKPHIVVGVEPGWPLWEQESFGPVFGVKIADSEEELVALANDTNYSLTSAVWTRDIAKGMRVGRKIYCGTSSVIHTWTQTHTLFFVNLLVLMRGFVVQHRPGNGERINIRPRATPGYPRPWVGFPFTWTNNVSLISLFAAGQLDMVALTLNTLLSGARWSSPHLV